MALSQLVTQVPGGLIKSGDWNSEFQNILTHPIALISPSTGAINFALQAHTNLIPSAITATSASAGQALMSTGGTTVSFQSVASLSVTATGSTGQVLAITSSNTAPAWQVIPISGGLTSGTVSTGTLFYVSSSGVLTPLAIGTTGQVLTVVSSLPTWTSSGLSAAGSGGSLLSSGSIQAGDDFLGVVTETSVVHTIGGNFYVMTSSGASTQTVVPNFGSPGGAARVTIANAGTFSWGTTDGNMAQAFWTTLNPDISVNVSIAAGNNGVLRLGLTSGVNGTAPTNGLYFQTSGSGSTWFVVARNAGTTFSIATTAVGSTANFQTLRIQVTSSGTGANIYTNGVLNGTAFTSSQLPSGQAFGFTFGNSAGMTWDIDYWTVIQNRYLGQSTL